MTTYIEALEAELDDAKRTLTKASSEVSRIKLEIEEARAAAVRDPYPVGTVLRRSRRRTRQGFPIAVRVASIHKSSATGDRPKSSVPVWVVVYDDFSGRVWESYDALVKDAVFGGRWDVVSTPAD